MLWTLQNIYRASSWALDNQKPSFKYSNLGIWKYNSILLLTEEHLDSWIKLAFVNANSPVPPTFKTQTFKTLVWIVLRV